MSEPGLTADEKAYYGRCVDRNIYVHPRGLLDALAAAEAERDAALAEVERLQAELQEMRKRYVMQTDRPIPEKDIERARQWWQARAAKEAGELDRMTALEAERDAALALARELGEALENSSGNRAQARAALAKWEAQKSGQSS